MAIACTQTATLFVLYVTPGKVETAIFTITNPPMQEKITWRPEEYQDDFLDEELARESAKNMASPSQKTNTNSDQQSNSPDTSSIRKDQK